MLLQAGVSTEQQSAHLDTHLRVAQDGSIVQVQDACSILGYTGPRVLEVMSTVAGQYEQLQVDAGDIVSNDGQHRASRHAQCRGRLAAAVHVLGQVLQAAERQRLALCTYYSSYTLPN